MVDVSMDARLGDMPFGQLLVHLCSLVAAILGASIVAVGCWGFWPARWVRGRA